jgi:hypothetical protein
MTTETATFLLRFRYASLAAATVAVPWLPPFRAASRQLAPAVAGSRGGQRYRLGPAMAAVHARDGGRLDRPRVDAARSAALSRPTVAATSGGVKSWCT